jgi:ipoprotein LpqH
VLRGLVIGVGSAALVVAGLTGCSSGDKAGDNKASDNKAEDKASAATATSGSVSASAGAGTAKVTIDGEPMDVQGQVACASNGGTFTIGVGDAATGIGIVMAEDASTVTSVGLGNVNGVALGFQEGAPGGSATATKDGKTYTVTGTATGVDMANPMQPVTKPFEIAVSCP